MTLPPRQTEKSRFSGPIRHYHRSGKPDMRSWEEWAEGSAADSNTSRNWIKILAILLVLLSIGGIIVWLVIELL